MILNKRARFLEVFDGFDPERMARYGSRRIAQLLKDPAGRRLAAFVPLDKGFHLVMCSN